MRSTLARQLGSATAAGRAAGPLASTSRPVLRAAISRASPMASVASSSRSIVTIPHPSLDPSLGETHFVIKSTSKITSMIQVFALVREAERKLGPIITMDVPRSADTFQPGNLVFITLLHPVKFNKEEPIVFEMDAPFVSKESTYLGGVTSADLSLAISGKPPRNGHQNVGPNTPMRVRIELWEKHDERMYSLAKFPEQRVRPSVFERREDSKLVDALKAFDGGFFGGLNGLADKYADLAGVPEDEHVPESEGKQKPTPLRRPQPVAEVVTPPEAAEPVAPVEPVEPKVPAAPARATKAEKMRLQALEVARRNAQQAAEAVQAKKDAEQAAATAAAAAPAAPAATPSVVLNIKPKQQEEKKSGWNWLSGSKS
ncbi:uncharacterized protein EHS24_008104 [Apiotrichum porosum]|uniref:Uncharacterized protein n=1 Tax=Apiotrichum porosum TaxID=105984 RepID=A0A427XSW1_9TREE|nr:uncharacterized protein EHS24_008104 [Apiotrichum porosum]RSH81907.1 hypothetical protein EHS24_008104 [Apiotrichum porosum]